MNEKLFKSLVLGIVLTVAILSFAGCKSKNAAKDNKSNSASKSEENVDNSNNSNKFYTYDNELFEIKTDYAELKYPSEYKENIKASVTNQDPYTVSFTTEINNSEVKVFDILFDSDEGYNLGTYKKDGKNVSVSTVDYSADFPKDISEEDAKMLDELAQSVNVIISNLIADYGFEVSA